MSKNKLLTFGLLLSASGHTAPFTVEDIRVEGLQRVASTTVFNYLTVKPGERFDVDNIPQTSKAIDDLYKSQLFSSIRLRRSGNVLIVEVKEYPVIGEINIRGNKDVSSNTIKEALGAVNFVEGQPFNPATLKALTKELNQQYQAKSKYAVKIKETVRPLDAGRVAVDLTIDEGAAGKIRAIDFVGNKIYSSKVLSELFDTTSPRWNSWFSKSDQLNDERFAKDLQRLEEFYKNRGFMDFRINSTQVNFSDDLASLYLTVNMSEGQVYKVSGYDIIGDLVVDKRDLQRLVAFRVGELYNQSLVQKTIEAIQKRLASEGYARAEVHLQPEQDKLTGRVKLILAVVPNRKTYVRKIEFTGNEKTYDVVLRRELRQQEASLYSATEVERSKERLERLPQLETVEEIIHPVGEDQVDIEYKVTERSTSSISAGIGYGQSSGMLFTANYKDDNFFGTGYQLGIEGGRSSAETTLGLDFTDPYFTSDGITASYRFNYNRQNYEKTDISDWTSDTWEGSTVFGYPISEYQKVYLGGGLRGVKIRTGTNVAPEIQTYLDKNGHNFREIFLSFAWARDSLDNPHLPTRGAYNRLGAEVVIPGSSKQYAKFNAQHRSFYSWGDDENSLLPTVGLRGEVSYGRGYGDSSDLPFYRRYYSGGINSVRGFEYGSLGPRYSNGDNAGGNLAVNGGVELLMPLRITQRSKNLRMGAFVDFGNAYKNFNDFKLGSFRYSTGLFVQWLSPIGPLNVSWAKPLNAKSGDKKEAIQFTIGTTF